MIPWRYRPGAGFVLFVTTTLLAGGFLAWGASTPPLDVVWSSLIQLEIGGDVPPSSRARLRDALTRHSGFADNVLDGGRFRLLGTEVDGLARGRLVLAVRREPEPPLTLTVQPGSSSPGRVRLIARVGGTSREAFISADEPFVWRLPDDGPFPQMAEIEIERPESSVRWSALVRLEEVSP